VEQPYILERRNALQIFFCKASVLFFISHLSQSEREVMAGLMGKSDFVVATLVAFLRQNKRLKPLLQDLS
jgi:hypothetical protein